VNTFKAISEMAFHRIICSLGRNV